MVKQLLLALLILVSAGCSQGGAILTPSATPPPTTPNASGSDQYQPTISMPADLALSGHLLMSGFDLGITRFDFATRQLVPIFSPPENGFVGAAQLSADGRTFFMIYSTPRDPKDPQYGASSLYTLPADGKGDPVPLLKNDDSGNYYFSPWWSPDGQSVYYGRHYDPFMGTPATQPVGYFLTRYTLPNGPAQDLLSNPLVVRISKDGKQMFYVSGDPFTTLSNIYSAAPDGTHAQRLLPGGEAWIVDSLAVSPDGQTLVFSSADSSSFQVSWWERLLGVSVAQAHNVPSDLFIMKIGGKPQQITHLADTGFIEDFSPDGQEIAFSCGSGVYVIHPDGSSQTQLLSQPVFGTLQWIPSR